MALIIAFLLQGSLKESRWTGVILSRANITAVNLCFGKTPRTNLHKNEVTLAMVLALVPRSPNAPAVNQVASLCVGPDADSRGQCKSSCSKSDATTFLDSDFAKCSASRMMAFEIAA